MNAALLHTTLERALKSYQRTLSEKMRLVDPISAREQWLLLKGLRADATLARRELSKKALEDEKAAHS